MIPTGIGRPMRRGLQVGAVLSPRWAGGVRTFHVHAPGSGLAVPLSGPVPLHRLLEDDVVASVVAGVTGVGVALVTTFAGPLFVDWLAQKRRGPVPPGPTAAQLEAWRALLRVAVFDRRVRGEGSQLDQMVRQGTVIDPRPGSAKSPPMRYWE